MAELSHDRSSRFSPEQYQTLLDVSESIASHRDLQALFADLADRIPRIVPFDFINLVLHDPVENVMRLHVLAAPETSTIRPGMTMPVDASPAGIVWTTQQPVLVENIALEARFPRLTPLLLENGVQSFGMLPLTTAFRRLGALGFGSLRQRTWPEGEIHFMQTVAKQIAVAVDNVLHNESTQAAQRQLTHERDRVQLLLEINNAVVSHLELEELFPAVSACLRKVIQHDGSSLVLLDEEHRRYRVHVLQFASNHSFIEEGDVEGDGQWQSPCSAAVITRRPAMFNEEQLQALHARSAVARFLLEARVKTFCSVPLLSHDRAFGALNVGRTHAQPFSDGEIELLGQVSRQVAIAVENARAYREISELKDRLAKENLYLEEEVRTEHNFEEIVGDSAILRRVLKQVETVAPTGSTVLICGETGTGKELIARALHDLSPRRGRTFVKLNCAAIPTGLLESELFGHERGAFTGAITQKIGRFELAHQGTLFLDEIGDIPPELQPKLLRALQEQEFERLGSTHTVRVDVRLVAATNRDLAQMVGDGSFRSDLYYRLNVFPVTLPPLRERTADIPMLARHFTQRFARRMGRRIEAIPAAVLDALVNYSWPGNIRELQNVIERAVILSPGEMLQVPVSELSGGIRASAINHRESAAVAARLPAGSQSTAPGSTLADAEREHILRVLRETDWVLGGPKGAAVRLAMKRTTLQSRMKKLGISRPN